MILHFLRHGQAEPFHSGKHGADGDRQLTLDGRKKMEAAAAGFLTLGVQFQKVICSPYRRAMQTAQIMADIFSYKQEIVFTENLIPEALFHKFRAEFLDSWAEYETLLVVTHQPFVSECISFLLTGREDPLLSINMGTGTLCTLEVDPHWVSPAILLSMTHAHQAAMLGKQA